MEAIHFSNISTVIRIILIINIITIRVEWDMEKISMESNNEQIITNSIFGGEFVSKRVAYDFLKRAMDVFLCIASSIIGIPIVLIACICVVFESKGFPIYSQERVGANGKIFRIFKIRSMYKNSEKDGPKITEIHDRRVTKVGKVIRKTRIDEIPQLINILKGDMSIIGPRPEREIFTYQFEEQVPGFVMRLTIRPGLTGLAQVNGGYEMTPEEKLKYDMEYIKNRSISLDIKILFKTVLVVLNGYGAR